MEMANKQKSDDFETVAALVAAFKLPITSVGLVDFTDFDDDDDDGDGVADFSFLAFLPDLVALGALDFVADADLGALGALGALDDSLVAFDLLDPSCLFIPCVFEFA
jgi:hypothetical protein